MPSELAGVAVGWESTRSAVDPGGKGRPRNDKYTEFGCTMRHSPVVEDTDRSIVLLAGQSVGEVGRKHPTAARAGRAGRCELYSKAERT